MKTWRTWNQMKRNPWKEVHPLLIDGNQTGVLHPDIADPPPHAAETEGNGQGLETERNDIDPDLLQIKDTEMMIERKVKSIVMNTRVVTRTEIGRSGVIAVVGTTRMTRTAAGTRTETRVGQGRTPRVTSV